MPHTREHMQEIGRRGGIATRDAQGEPEQQHEYYRLLGQKGGMATHKRHGGGHMARIGKAGAYARTGDYPYEGTG